jgi:hypothetical protein
MSASTSRFRGKHVKRVASAPGGGSARDYRELPAPLAIAATAEQAAAGPHVYA